MGIVCRAFQYSASPDLKDRKETHSSLTVYLFEDEDVRFVIKNPRVSHSLGTARDGEIFFKIASANKTICTW